MVSKIDICLSSSILKKREEHGRLPVGGLHGPDLDCHMLLLVTSAYILLAEINTWTLQVAKETGKGRLAVCPQRQRIRFDDLLKSLHV